PQETFDLTIDCFNLSEQYRVPVFLMMDECVGHMTEKVVIPKPEDIELVERRYYNGPKESYFPFKPDEDLIPRMVKAGDGYRFHITGLTHDERGYPVMNWQTQEKLVHRLVDKIRKNADKIIHVEEDGTDSADVVIVSYGISSRVAYKAIAEARRQGIKVGFLRLIVVWPFPEKKIFELAGKVKTLITVEINYGQIALEVERCAKGRCKTLLVSHGGGWVHNPDDILAAIKDGLK
ncbi:MAG: transketolase C-terminal domain-containing protein, partial [candidate division WOR-3 bacterium]